MSVRYPAVIALGFWILLLSGCATSPELPELQYTKSLRPALYRLKDWAFEGRLALTGKNDSWSANVNWQHSQNQERIKLSGPLGQGAVLITVAGETVTIDRGNGNVQSSPDVEGFVAQQLGLSVPVKLLRFWILGVPDPELPFNETDNGFTQLNWLNEYKQMMQTDNLVLPQKIVVTKDKLKMKVMVDQWVLAGAHGK